MECCYWTTVCLRAISQPMSRREESPKESIEYPRPLTPCQGLPGGHRLHCWKFGSAGHPYPPRLPDVGYGRLGSHLRQLG